MPHIRLPRPNLPGLHNLRGDLAGGLTAAIVALPLALAFGMASGAGPLAGLYGAICVGFFAALFGGTASQISGPTGPMTIVAASVFTHFANEPAVAFTVVLMAGGFQVLFGYLRLGRFVNLMPYPVISGFMTGIGCILVIMQLDPLLGYPNPGNVINALTVLPGYLAQPNGQAVLVGCCALAVTVFTPARIGRVIPAHLLALIVTSLLALPMDQVPLLGSVAGGPPQWVVPHLDLAQIGTMLVWAAVLAALGSIDSLLTSLVADNVTRTFHDSDRELIGQGIGNMVAGLAGGIPGAGATIRTLSNVHAGGRTPWSGMVHALVLLAIALGLGPVVAFVPVPALAGILLKVGFDVIDWQFVRRVHRAPRSDFVLMLVVLLLTIFVDVITAVGAGVVIASLVLVKEMAEAQVEAMRTIVDPEQERLFDPATAQIFRRYRDRSLYLHLAGLISFGAANEMTRRFNLVGTYEVLLIDLLDVPRIDLSAALALEELIQRAGNASKEVYLIGLTAPVARLMGKLGSLDLIRETNRFDTRAAAGLALERRFCDDPEPGQANSQPM